ncbi:hypothetical protein PT2222_300029 [Paraburkholderia tropica]
MKRGGRRGDRHGGDDNDRRVAERERKADFERTLPGLHELARDVVDGGDVIGVKRVAQTERPGQQARAEQRGMIAENADGPQPRARVQGQQEGVEGGDLVAQRRPGGGRHEAVLGLVRGAGRLARWRIGAQAKLSAHGNSIE